MAAIGARPSMATPNSIMLEPVGLTHASPLRVDEGSDAGANVLRLRLDRGQERVQAAPRLIELIHEGQHHGHAVFLDPQLVVQLVYETDPGHVGVVEAQAVA